MSNRTMPESNDHYYTTPSARSSERHENRNKHRGSEDEYSPLLPPDAHPVKTSSFVSAATPIAYELQALVRSSVPVISSYILQNSIQTISIIAVGRSMPHNLSAAAFTYMFSTCSGWLIGMGGSTALDTLASTAFTGGSNKHQTGILLQRCIIVLTLLYIPVCIIWAFSDRLFILLGQDPELSLQSRKFLTCLIPGGLGYIYFEALKKYLQVQGLVHPPTYVMLVVSPLSAVLNYLFINTSLGLLGAPLATGISYWLSFAGLVLYTRYVAGYECWNGWDKACLSHLGIFFRIALLGIIQLGTEFWAFEIVALIAGNLGKLPLAGQSVLMTADQVLVTIPFGIGVASSVRVGGALGSRDAKGARRAAHTATILAVSLAVIICLTLIVTRNHFAKLFTSDMEVVKYVANVMPWIGLFQIADAVNGSCGGSLRGTGKQHIGAAANITSYYVIALPLGYWLAFRGWELSGLWIAQCIGMGCVALFELMFVLRTNWQKEIDLALERIHEGSEQDETV
ncbi:unnamed protein product [Clonostachys byssicola]|uniref:MATE efflux family protein n=1 Tax=Clonostachys byssicola TaxID=160290 RepID=A0A9N9XWW1_9HYPO|nr:unnamed protein product [Clonostachys byssicola]